MRADAGGGGDAGGGVAQAPPNRDDAADSDGLELRRRPGCTQPRCRPAANPSAAAPKATSSTAVNVDSPTATSAPWKTPTTTSPIAQLEAKPAAVKNSSSRCGRGVLSNARTAARLVPGRRPLNNPRTSASRLIARAAASGAAAVDAGRTRTARMPGATR